jgi:O-succinylbenzoic acid--CoA ligase
MEASSRQLTALCLPPGEGLRAELERAWREGNAVAPLDPGLPRSGLEAALATLRPHTLVEPGATTSLADPEPVAPGTAAVVTTSGSTGEPKAVALSWAAMEASARASLQRLGAEPDDRWLCCVPTHHVAGLQVLVRSLVLGVTPMVHDGFDVEAVAAAEGVSLVSLVPTMLRRLLDAGVELSRFRKVLLGGAMPSPELLAEARDAGTDVVVSYGMTETCGGCVYDGLPLDGVWVRLGPSGEIGVAGSVLFDGYRGEPARTAAVCDGGWLETADLGRWDSDGRLEVVGRADEVIVTGGEKVAPQPLEGLLVQHPGVAEAAVVGRDDPEWGQAVVAAVVAGEPPPSLEQLRTLVKAHRPAWAAPADLELVDALPRLGSGKLDRRAVADEVARRAEQAGGGPSRQ